jgi:hypothetical protein
MVEGIPMWVGLDYLVWSAASSFATWLYEKDGKIFLEITPTYPWTFIDPEPEETFISYNQFIQNYHSYIIKEISRDIISQWHKETERLLKIVNDNEALYIQQQQNEHEQ